MVNLEDIKLNPILDSLLLCKIEDDDYFHNEKYKSRISNSRLGLLKKGGEEAFLQGFTGGGFNPSFKLGSIVHSMILQEDLFDMCDTIDLPTAKLGAVVEYLYPYWKANNITTETITEASNKIEYYKDKLTQTIIDNILKVGNQFWKQRFEFEKSYTSNKEVWYMDPTTREKAHGCINAIHNNNNIMNILHPTDLFGNPITSECEWAILLDAEVIIPNQKPFVISLKSKLDNFVINKEENKIQINDIKTTIRDTRSFEDVIIAFDYERELAMYAILLSLVAKKYYNMDNPEVSGNFLVVSTINPYYTRVVPVSNTMFKNGLNDFKKLIRSASVCLNNNHLV